MRELRDIVAAYEARPGDCFVLATVMATRGSTYRKPGARMLLSEQAWLSGAISGGCVEADLIRKAWWRTARAGTALVTYDGALGQDDVQSAMQQGFGLGCDGSMDVLLERIAPGDAPHSLAQLAAALAARQPSVLSTVVSAPPHADVRLGQSHWLGNGRASGNLSSALGPLVRAQAAELLASHARARVGTTRPATCVVDGMTVGVVHELIVPPPRLLVFGQNYDALPVASLAEQLGWDVVLVAQREPHRPFRSPALPARVVLGRAPDVLARLELDARCAALVMTHNYHRDKQTLAALLPHELAYVGVLGPERRTRRMLDELAQSGVRASQQALAKLHAPVGLDLGAASPEEIALSIVAELQAELRGASARPRRADYRPRALRSASQAVERHDQSRP